MTSPRGTVFRTNPNKDFLRRGYDTGHVERLFRSLGRPLKYLGLPAWEMLDILEWDKYLSRFTTIEREENQQHLRPPVANRDTSEGADGLWPPVNSLVLDARKATPRGRRLQSAAMKWQGRRYEQYVSAETADSSVGITRNPSGCRRLQW